MFFYKFESFKKNMLFADPCCRALIYKYYHRLRYKKLYAKCKKTINYQLVISLNFISKQGKNC